MLLIFTGAFQVSGLAALDARLRRRSVRQSGRVKMKHGNVR
jgi:hypothetical protein